MGLLNKKDIERNIKILEENQNDDGGIGTFSFSKIRAEIENKNYNFPVFEIDKYKGWCSSDTQVSSISMLALLKCGISPKSKIIRKIIDFIIKKQHMDGFWNAYWSNGKMLGTTFCINALRRFSPTASICVADRELFEPDEASSVSRGSDAPENSFPSAPCKRASISS